MGVWVGALTLIIDYMFAVALTKLVGHHYHMFGAHQAKVKDWFGNVPNSMRTLFIVMTLAEWDEIALTVETAVPGYIVFFVAIAYVMICAFTMVSLIIGIISDAIANSQGD